MLTRWEHLFLGNQLAATIIASASALTGPYACYAGVHTQAESVHQNCVRKMCVFVSNHSATPKCS